MTRPSSSPPKVDRPADGEEESDLLEEVERRHIRRILEGCSGNKTLAAKKLGLSLRSLYRRLEKLDIT